MDNEMPKLTSGELSHIWESLMNDSLAAVVLEYFNQVTESDKIRSVCSFAIQMVKADKGQMESLMKNEDYPLPDGFTDKDLNKQARKPVTDVFVLFFLHHMAQSDLAQTAISLADAVREDIRKLYSNRMVKSMAFYNQAVSLLLEKGIFVRSPIISSSHEANPKAKEGFFASFFNGNSRPLTVREANELHKQILYNHTGRSLLMALHQSNKHPELKDLLMRGKELASKIINDFSDLLIDNDLPVAMTWDTHVLDTTDSPFSDKLTAYLLDRLNKIGLANYGFGFAISERKDLKTLYTKTITDVYQYQLDVESLMVENEWMERPPLALDRRKLSGN